MYSMRNPRVLCNIQANIQAQARGRMQYTGNLPSDSPSCLCLYIIKHSCSSTCITYFTLLQGPKGYIWWQMWWWWEWGFPSGEWTRWGNSLSIVLHLLLNLPTSISLTQYHAHVHVQSGGFYIIGASPYLVINVAILSVCLCVHCIQIIMVHGPAHDICFWVAWSFTNFCVNYSACAQEATCTCSLNCTLYIMAYSSDRTDTLEATGTRSEQLWWGLMRSHKQQLSSWLARMLFFINNCSLLVSCCWSHIVLW